MRTYFRHARSIHGMATQLLDEIPAARSSLLRQFQSWRARVSNSDFSVVDGLIYLQQPSALHDVDFVLRVFQFMAHHGLRLSATTSRRIEQVLPQLAMAPPQGAAVWRSFAIFSSSARCRSLARHALSALADAPPARIRSHRRAGHS